MDRNEELRAQASDWLTRMRGPDAEASRRDFETWLAASPDHRDAYERVQRGFEKTLFTGNLDVVRNRDLDRAVIWYRRPALQVAAAACFAVLLAGGLLGIVNGGWQTPAARAMAYESRVGEIRSITLTDGTHVTLDAASAISVGKEETRLVRGRARFSVTGVRDGALVVAVNDLSVAATDGDFEVDVTPHVPRVTALRGEARISRRGGQQNAAFWTLRAGQQFLDGGSAPRPAAPAGADWAKGMLAFDGERLDDAIAAFNRYNTQRITLSDPALGALRITGAFHANDPHGFAQAVAAMFRLSVGEASGGFVLGPRKKT